MSLQISFSPWISTDLYNQLPSVEDARKSTTEEYQFNTVNSLANAIPDLIGKVGVTITHRHHILTKENETIIGHLENQCLYSEPKYRTKDACPTTWVAAKEILLATEGMDNPSIEVRQISAKIHEYASKILPFLTSDSNKKFSRLSIAIDPRIIFDTNKKKFLEKNDNEKSIFSPIEQDLDEFKNAIPTYLSLDSPKEEEFPTLGKCRASCDLRGDTHSYVHSW